MKKEIEQVDWLKFENEAYENGYNCVCGVDEAGRGPLAGPVFAAAVVLGRGQIIDGVNDSKKLSEKKREALFDKIKEEALCYSIASVDEKTIDEINILNATFFAMKKAVEGLEIKPDFAMIDGNKTPDLSIDCEAVVKGDANSVSIAAASILAKVSRDRYMLEMAEKYPEYKFEKHKGYGTKLHYQMLDEYGPSEIHRQTFLKTWYAKK
ncbi:ribonuclease HII [Eubacterium coprostanoligenes]|uniref:ribonuclease HII n=1 Tax=Eubacterium coprostanoligenes TaxID=290054 RepID=UPI002A80EAB7|nr:ribonuclease HII [Eubacterium coprostanoligenes]MDY4699099.1 ribonuclease HII [Eubacterium coprostanoligenes]